MISRNNWQCVWHTTFPARRPSSLQSIPVSLFRRGYFLYRRLWRLRSRHLALAVVHGRYDLCRPYRPTDTGTVLSQYLANKLIFLDFIRTNGFLFYLYAVLWDSI